ncbi:hypothetical protein KI387_010750 [Taxus chinensis]|uniref:DUF6821 domain-containing protein n=1 Tax=Taxus chinensis TaxID=29808 RepID=A0AA38FLW1_TAXCH|nr:hypothetical protein KI387_010750 [Taxus chinensis]
MGCEEQAYRDDWEVLEINSVPSSIRGEDEDDEDQCFPVEIELGSLIDANYFACPSPEYNPDENFDAKSLAVVDDGFRVQSPAPAPHSSDDSTEKIEEILACKEMEENSASFEAEKNSGVLARSGVIEGLCIIRPLVVTELALFRVDSSFNSWKTGMDEEEGLKVVAVEESKVISRPSSPRIISRPSSPRVVSSPTSPRVNSCTVERSERRAGKENFVNRLGVWRKRFGMLSSFGMAAAVVGLVILGRRFYLRKPNHSKDPNQTFISFQIYGDDRSINRLKSEAARLNEALSAGKGGMPVVRAQISFGGYYDGV